MQHPIIKYKTFPSYNEVLYYLLAVGDAYKIENISWESDVWFREHLNDYKVRLRVYDC